MQSLGLRHEICEGDLLELEWIVHSPSHSPENYLGQAETNAVDSLSVGRVTVDHVCHTVVEHLRHEGDCFRWIVLTLKRQCSFSMHRSIARVSAFRAVRQTPHHPCTD